MILPVLLDITIVAALSLSSIIAREETRTVISEESTVDVYSRSPSSMECGVSVPVANGAILPLSFAAQPDPLSPRASTRLYAKQWV